MLEIQLNKTFQQDIQFLNILFLNLIRSSIRENRSQAAWTFYLKENEMERITAMTIEEVIKTANCGRALFKLAIIPNEHDSIISRYIAALDGNTTDRRNNEAL